MLQGPHLLKMMAREIGMADRLLVKQTLRLYNESFPDGVFQLNETLMYRFPNAFRSEISAESSERLHIVSNGSALTVLDNKVVAQTESEFDWYKDLLLYNSRASLEKRLPSLGVDISVSSLGRFQGKVAYIIGAQYPDESVPQVWLDKTTFRPFRWILKSDTGHHQGLFEVRYLEWQKIHDVYYPMHIEFYQSAHIIRDIRVDSIQVDVNVADHLFNIERIRDSYPLNRPVVSNQGEPNELNEVQKSLQEFNRIID